MTTEETIQDISARLETAKRGHNACAGIRDRWMAEAARLRAALKAIVDVPLTAKDALDEAEQMESIAINALKK